MIPDLRMAEVEYSEKPAKAWKIDFENKRLSGFVDGAAAVAQSALMTLQTPRYMHIIFSRQYGSELRTLVDMDPDYIFSEGKRMIEDALSTDPRVLEARDFTFENGVIAFTLDTVYGTTTMDTGGILLGKNL